MVYVSTQGTDGPSCGASGAPCKTIQQGVAQCSAPGCGVVVRFGLYKTAEAAAPLPDRIVVKDGVSIFGSCRFEGDADGKYWTVVQAPDDGEPGLTASGINSATVVQGLFVKASDAKTAGKASIAATVSGSSGLVLRNVHLASARGADGAPGATPGDADVGEWGYPALGDTGGGGGSACYSNPPPNQTGSGGKGADIQQVYSHVCIIWCYCDNNNYPNSVGQPGMSSGSIGGGGGGGRGSDGCGCNNNTGNAGDGPPGNPGNPGACGTDGGEFSFSVWGSFGDGPTWMASKGAAGKPGQVGSGGGGGGSGGMATQQGSPDYHGRPGGGGGGGGCGGNGGGGGQQGGASIPLVLYQSKIQRDGLVLIPGVGGQGGAGGTGGKGGPGGAGNPGQVGHRNNVSILWTCNTQQPGSGGKGGDGGQGGAGAGGAGGNGGPSVGMAAVGGSSYPTTSQGIYLGLAGAGGLKGAGGQNAPSQCTAVAGQDGGPGGTAAVMGNLMVAGEQLSRNQSRLSSGGRYLFIMQGDANLCLYDLQGAAPAWMWCTQTEGTDAQIAVLETDGNLVLYDSQHGHVWDTKTPGHTGASLFVGDDGHVVISDGNGTAYWSTQGK
jgi:hypothetical protein